MIKYTLNDAFNIINLIINEEREKYENIIKTMNQKISDLELEIKQLKEENKNYKDKIFQFQNHFYSLSKTFYNLNDNPQKQLINEKNKNIYFNKNNGNQNIEKSNDFFQTISSDNNNLNNNILKNNWTNLKESNLNVNDSMKQQLFNKKLFQKINNFNIKNEKNISKIFNNKINEPIKFNKKIVDNYSQQTYSQNLNDLNERYKEKNNNNIDSIKYK